MQKRWLVLCVVLAAGGCVIGPKQDDPVSGASNSDTGVISADTGQTDEDVGGLDDATVTPADDAGTGADTQTSDASSTDSSSSDAPASDSSTSIDTGSSVDGGAVDASDGSADVTIDASDALTEGG